MAYGKRLLPLLIDEIASKDTEKIWLSIPKTTSKLSDGFVDLSFARCANAINRITLLLVNKLGRGDGSKVIWYTRPSDIRYYFVCNAAVKAGYTVSPHRYP